MDKQVTRGRESGPSLVRVPARPGPLRTDAGDIVSEVLAALLLIAALLFGGGPRGTGDMVVHLAMIPCLAAGILRWHDAPRTRWQRGFLAWWIAALALVTLQLLPLPPSVAGALPQRAGVLSDLALAGLPASDWRPLTLDTWATTRALLAVASAGAAWLLASTLSGAARRRLLIVALATGALLALLGFAQAAAGENALRFHAYHHPLGALGTFANRNHFAACMGMLLPFALAFGRAAQADDRIAQAAAWFALGIALWLAAALSFSRAGFALASCALLASCAALWLRRDGGRRWMAPALAVAIAVLAVAHYAWDGLLQRLQQDPVDDLRWQYLRHGLAVARDYLPWGSGLGSFPWVYAPAEPLPQTIAVYAERAHNDLLQVAIEAGVPGLLLLAAFLAFSLFAGGRNFLMGREGANTDDCLRRVMPIALLVPLLHSLVDYPLRTLALAVLLGLLLSFQPPEARAPGR